MARQIRDLKDKKTKVKFFPKTHVKAVVDDHGNKLDAILDNKVGTDSEVSTSGEFVYAQDENGKSVRIAKDSIAKIIADEIAKIPNALASVNFGATTMPELSAAVGTKLYGATDASGLASVVAEKNGVFVTGAIEEPNEMFTSGVYVGVTTSNKPSSIVGTNWTLIVFAPKIPDYNPSLVIQMAFGYTSGFCVRRYSFSERHWSNWSNSIS